MLKRKTMRRLFADESQHIFRQIEDLIDALAVTVPAAAPPPTYRITTSRPQRLHQRSGILTMVQYALVMRAAKLKPTIRRISAWPAPARRATIPWNDNGRAIRDLKPRRREMPGGRNVLCGAGFPDDTADQHMRAAFIFIDTAFTRGSNSVKVEITMS
ncbi:MAG: hypothetical protein U0528_14080 [Anaerolineae bacterium]